MKKLLKILIALREVCWCFLFVQFLRLSLFFGTTQALQALEIIWMELHSTPNIP